MKQKIEITGTVELDRQEISKAISEWLEKHHNLKTTKIVYLPYQIHLDGAVCQIHKEVEDDLSFCPQEKVVKQRVGKKHIKGNKGLYKRLNEEIDEIRNSRKDPFVSEIITTLRSLHNEIKELYPGLDYKQMRFYLQDKRMFKNIKIDGDFIKVFKEVK